jgi:hypothetical protein
MEKGIPGQKVFDEALKVGKRRWRLTVPPSICCIAGTTCQCGHDVIVVPGQFNRFARFLTVTVARNMRILRSGNDAASDRARSRFPRDMTKLPLGAILRKRPVEIGHGNQCGRSSCAGRNRSPDGWRPGNVVCFP